MSTKKKTSKKPTKKPTKRIPKEVLQTWKEIEDWEKEILKLKSSQKVLEYAH